MTADLATDIVLVGAGHAHVHVMAAFATNPARGVRLTLVARDLQTPYSGMMPGVIAGLYAPEEAQIDLVRLARATGTRLVHGEAVGLDRTDRRVRLADGGQIAYDLLSIDVGIAPALSAIAGAADHGVPVKPIGSFLEKLAELRVRCRDPRGPRHIAVIGGGAGGVELLLSVRARLLADAAGGIGADDFAFLLVTDGVLLEHHNARVGDAFRRIFAERAVALHEHRRVIAIHPGIIETAEKEPIFADVALVATGAAAPAWLAGTGLALDRGFLAVGPTLQSLNDPDIFAAGDCASLATPREKAGVYAVRAGPPLARNLSLRARKEPPLPWRPQRRHLALITTGERYAVASRGCFKTEGRWVWTLKDFIDRRWMRAYQNL